MTTVEEVLQRLVALEQEAQRLRAEAAASHAEAQQARQEAQAATLGLAQRATAMDQVAQALAGLPAAVATAVTGGVAAARPIREAPRQMIDPKGLGRPPSFNGDESAFGMWSKKTENFVMSAFPESVEILKHIVEAQNVLDIEEVKKVAADQLGVDPSVTSELNLQLYSVLMSLCSGEP